MTLAIALQEHVLDQRILTGFQDRRFHETIHPRVKRRSLPAAPSSARSAKSGEKRSPPYRRKIGKMIFVGGDPGPDGAWR